jgi:hypothetical protein
MIPLTSVLYVWSVTGTALVCHSVETAYALKGVYTPMGAYAPKDVNSCHVQIPIVRKKDPSGSFIVMMDSV